MIKPLRCRTCEKVVEPEHECKICLGEVCGDCVVMNLCPKCCKFVEGRYDGIKYTFKVISEFELVDPKETADRISFILRLVDTARWANDPDYEYVEARAYKIIEDIIFSGTIEDEHYDKVSIAVKEAVTEIKVGIRWDDR